MTYEQLSQLKPELSNADVEFTLKPEQMVAVL